MLVSSSLGRCLDGLVGVILLRDAIVVVFDLQEGRSRERLWLTGCGTLMCGLGVLCKQLREKRTAS